jgi:uncharacterized membrane protein YhiD involved in acid resistance
VSGIGLLGAGVILKNRGGVRGLTTAATLWSNAGVGMACGAGMLLLPLVCTAVGLSLLAQTAPEERNETLKRLDDIENEVNKMRMPLAFADQFYVLRDHIAFVRARYAKGDGGS